MTKHTKLILKAISKPIFLSLPLYFFHKINFIFIIAGIIVLLMLIFQKQALAFDSKFEAFFGFLGRQLLNIILIFSYYTLFFPLSFLNGKKKLSQESSLIDSNLKVTQEEFNKQW